MKGSARDTPMMRQYLSIKAKHPDAILCYRMGDFYELFMEDAEQVAPILDITLTTRDKGKADAVPMCGFPVHAADGHIKKLAALGHRVAICEQVEDAKAAGGKRLVKREVVEVVTPGLIGDPSGIEAASEVAVAALAGNAGDGHWGLAALDASTGDFRTTEVEVEVGVEVDGRSLAGLPALLVEELERVAPRELLLSEATRDALEPRLAELLPDLVATVVGDETWSPSACDARPEGFDPDAGDAATRAAAALLHYLGVNQPFAIAHAPRLRRYRLGDTMVLDAATCSHLELFENNEDRGRRGTLIERIDASATPLGARRLGRWVRYPLLHPEAIAARQDAVAALAERDRSRARLRDVLKEVRDLERILAKAIRPGAVPRDVGALRSSLEPLPRLAAALAGPDGAELLEDASALPAGIVLPEPLPDLVALLQEGLIDDPPVVARGSRGANETGYIREGFRSELDGLREAATKGREWIAGLEAEERERSGIATLKVRFHPVHGYSLEVGKAHIDRVPDDYERKQTLASVERFTTAALREMETRVMGANERAAALERQIFDALREQVATAAPEIRRAADAVAELDALAALAEVARREGWVRPTVDAGPGLEITAGRHPVVEAMLDARSADGFVPNDTALSPEDAQIVLITGPNMSGKSTYLRQVALIVLLAQVGSFVPAEAARVGVVDRIFTRVGASDRLARGESTFMVEMRETAEILAQATQRSLVILDEIGRGTSTFDGLSIAWAVAEHLHDTPGVRPRTLFATHYHELTDLSLTKSGVRNAHFEVREWKEEVVFLRRMVSGGANRSYGIQVARLAGLPDAVIARAREILANLEGDELDGQGKPRIAGSGRRGGAPEPQQQLPLGFAAGVDAAEQEVLDRLRELDPDHMTPVDALVALSALRRSLDDPEAT